MQLAGKGPRPGLGFWRRNAPLWLIGAFTLLFGSILANLYAADLCAEAGIRCYRQGAYSQAEGWLRRSVGIDPQGGQACYYLGLCLVRDGRKDAALREFRVALSVGQGAPRVMSRDEALAQEAQAQIALLGH